MPTSRHISTRITVTEAKNTSSWPKGSPPMPTASDTAANTSPPPSTHQLTGGRSACASRRRAISAAATPCAFSRLRVRARSTLASSTPSTEMTGISRAISYTVT